MTAAWFQDASVGFCIHNGLKITSTMRDPDFEQEMWGKSFVDPWRFS